MKVLIAMDGSHHADKAFDWYCENLHKEENEIFVYSHCDPPQVPATALGGFNLVPGAGLPSISAAQLDMMIKDHKHKCANLKKALTEKCKVFTGNATVLVETDDGSSGSNIVKKAQEISADLIVTGSRGLGTIRRTILGSVSDYVLHHVQVPVIVFKD
uniref:Uncharacterized protein LOC100180855 n=1 Tax=Phallusia mammillata TaxID=59560 RepID=A0A6F9DGS5_9ASCI|nr:uncharacterized protein LOC100180855 [Phallusia mammillata]